MIAKALLTAVALVIAVAGTAQAAPPRPQVLARGSDLGGYSLVGNGAGGRVIVLPRDVTPDRSGLNVFSAPPGAPFGGASRIRGARVPTFNTTTALGPDGTVAIVGLPPRLGRPVPDRLVALVRPPGKSFGKPKTISGPVVDEASVSFDRQGAAMAIWTRFASKGDASYVEESTRPPGGPWSKPTLISYERRGATSPQVAFDAAGDAVAVWDRTGSPIKGELVKPTTKPRRHTFQTEVVAATRTAGGTFRRPQVVSDPRFDSDEASLSVNSAGQAALAWVLNTHNDKHFRIGAAFREPGERFGKAHFLTPDGRDSYGASIALDEQGRALLVWAIEGERRTMESDDNQVLAAVRSPGGPLEAPLKLSDRHASFPEAAMAPDGRAMVGWVRQSGQGNLVQARAITTAGVYGPLTAVSPRGWIDNLATTIDDSGASAFTWTREGSGHRDRLEAITLAR